MLSSGGLTAITSSIAALVMVGGMVFVAGKLAMQVNTNTSDIADAKKTIGGHAAQLASHDSQIARLEGFGEGYKAGTHVSGGGD